MKCKNCKYWTIGGKCLLLNHEAMKVDENDLVHGEVEGCVDVYDRHYDFVLLTGENFGCIHFKKK